MAFLNAFGLALPTRIVTNDELAPQLAVDPAWILAQSGIRERRYAAPEDTIASLGLAAARNCLENANTRPEEVGLILVSSGSPDRFCPGPASAIAAQLGLTSTPALDLPIPSAGALTALVLASKLAETMGNVLVIASEIMSRRIALTPAGRNTAILFGDGAGAALISPTQGFARIAATALHTDGNSAEALSIQNDLISMDGPAIIRHASRKFPQVIEEVLSSQSIRPDQVGTYLLHQANANLFARIASTLKADPTRFFSNIDRYGNTSSASLLIAAAEWHAATLAAVPHASTASSSISGSANTTPLTAPIILSAFGVGLNWGAILAVPIQ